MIRRKKEEIEWLEFEQFQDFPELIHAVFLRQLDCVVESNKETICEILGLPKMISSKQVHGDKVMEASVLLECDGLVTAEKNTGLIIAHADCQAAIFYDPIRKVIANVHSGWRGSVQNIYAKTVQYLKERFQCDPANLFVGIGPSLGPNRAEFINHRVELPSAFLPFQFKENYFDFWEISKMQLSDAGICKEHIEIAGICTYCEENDFFSYRRDKKTARNGTVVALKQ